MHDSESKNWGTLDFVYINGMEICLMYFNSDKVALDINNILGGNRLNKEDYFYPIGRCATLKTINILYDKNDFLKGLKDKLSIFPEELHKKMIAYHFEKLNDLEDLKRAVSLGDVLFFHYALDLSIDHFLQILFTLNRCFFPSRKRNLKYIKEFTIKPKNIENRILDIIQLGGNIDTIEKSYAKWEELIKEIMEMKALY
jgi:hypothetical protein